MNLKRVATAVMLVLAVTLSFSCATLFTKGGGDYRAAKKAYDAGKYAEALEKDLLALEANAEFPEAIELLQKIFNDGNDRFLSTLENGRKSADPAEAKAAWEALEKLIELNEIAAASGRRDLAATDYSADREPVKVNMLDAWFNVGQDLMASGEVMDARKAYEYFLFVDNIEGDYSGAASKMKEAEDMGTVTIAIYTRDDYQKGVVEYSFEESRWLKVAPFDRYTGTSMVGPLDQMMNDLHAGKLDYVVRTSTKMEYEQIFKDEEGTLPAPLGVYEGHKYTIGYSSIGSMTYTLIGPGMTTVTEETLEKNTNETFEMCKVPHTKVEKLSFDGNSNSFKILEGEPGLSWYDAGLLFAAYTDNKTYELTVAENPGDHKSWVEYFRNTYDSSALGWRDFVDDFEGKVFFEANLYKDGSEEGGYRPVYTDRSIEDLEEYDYSIQMAENNNKRLTGFFLFLMEYLPQMEDYGRTDTSYELIVDLCNRLKATL